MYANTVSMSSVSFGRPFGMPDISMNSMAWHAQRAAAQLSPLATQMGGCIPMSMLAQMAYGEFSVPNRQSAQFMLGQPQLIQAMQNYQEQHGGSRWGSYGRPCLSQSSLNWLQGNTCWNSMPASCSVAPMQFPCMKMQSSQLDFNSCARTLNRSLNGSRQQSLSMQDMVDLAKGTDPVVAEAAGTFLRNPQWMQQITGGDGNISRADLNRASISPQNAADARTVATHMSSIGMNVMPSDAIMHGQSKNMVLPQQVREAYARLMEGGEYSAYRAIEQFDVNKQPDGCSAIGNFVQAASSQGF